MLIVGGGVAGLSLAAALAGEARVTVLEAEAQPGFHASGRSATMLHFALGDQLVRSLTLASRPFFDSPPEGFADIPLGRSMALLVHAREEEREQLAALSAAVAPFAALEQLDEAGLRAACPLLKVGEGGAVAGLLDPAGIRLDPHAMLQGYLRQLRARGGTLVTGARVGAIARDGAWRVETEAGARFSAPVLVDAAGAWADRIAALAGARQVGLRPLRRTVITVDGPSGVAVNGLPFTRTIGDELYFAPEAGRLFASPMDEEPSAPCDAQPDEYAVALAAHRLGERTHVEVRRIHGRWAGLRTFAPDRHPVVGFDPRLPGFFWLAGQGGYGLQTAPALSAAAAALIRGDPWPWPAIAAEALDPSRFS